MTLKAEKRARRAAEQARTDGGALARVSFHRLNYSPCPDNERPARFGFECPRGRGRCTGLLIAGTVIYDVPLQSGKGGKPACWEWDGNRERPSFSPSINCLAHNPKDPNEKYAGCGWHGHIKNGAIVG